ncbi:MAG: ribosome-associated translation inhibitor RaiA [Bacteroidota bacterium]
MKVHTQSLHFSADAKLIAFIEKKLSKLDQFFERIVNADVVLKLENSGQVRDKIVEVRISLPGSVLVAKESAKTFEASIDSVTSSLKRQLIKFKEKNNRVRPSAQ